MKKTVVKEEKTLKGPRIAPLRAIMFLVFAAALVAGDQLAKSWVLSNETLRNGGTIPLIPGLFDLAYTFNTGAAWSILAEHSWGIYVLTGISAAAALLFFVFLIKRSGWPFAMPFSLTLVFAGTVGNLIDRVYLQGVVDFFDFHYGDWHFPTFNIADSLIVVGIILLLIYLLFFEVKFRERFEQEQKIKVRPL